MKQARKTAALIIAFAMLVSACSGNASTPATQTPATQTPATQTPATQTPATQAPATQAPATPAPATPAPVVSSNFTSFYTTEVSTLNYLITNRSVDAEMTAKLVDQIVQNDRHGTIVPAIAKEWSTKDSQVWTIKLREDVNWFKVDGSVYGKLTANDFVTGMKYILDKNNASKTVDMITSFIKGSKEYYSGETTDFSTVGIKAVNDYTLEYTCYDPTPFFMSLLTYTSYLPVNEKFLNEIGKENFGTDADKILYSGGYLLKNWQRDREQLFVKNPNYYQADRVHVPEVKYTKIEDSSVAVEMYKRGEISAVGISSTNLDLVRNDPQFAPYLYQVSLTASSYYYGFNYSSTNPDFVAASKNLNFRKAIYHGFDRTGLLILSNPYEPETLRTNLLVAPEVAISPAGKDYVSYGNLPKITERETFDEELARKYLAEAKKELGGSVKWPLTIRYPVASTEAGARSGSLFKQLIEDVFQGDIVVELAQYASGKYYEMLDTRAWDITSQGWGPDYADPSTYLHTLLPGGEMERFDLSDLPEGQEYARLIGIASKIYDIDARYEAYAKAEEYIIENALVIPYRRDGGNYALNNIQNPYDAPKSSYGQSRYLFLDRIYGDKPLDPAIRNEQRAQYYEEKAARAAGK